MHPVTFSVLGAGNICLSAGAYDDLSLNMADILRWMREARFQILYYRDDLQLSVED